jgi:hypothetical protein
VDKLQLRKRKQETDMTTTKELETTTDLKELDAIIAAASQRKKEIYDAELQRLIDEIEQRCETLGITLQELLAIVRKHRRKTRAAHKDNGSEE